MKNVFVWYWGKCKKDRKTSLIFSTFS